MCLHPCWIGTAKECRDWLHKRGWSDRDHHYYMVRVSFPISVWAVFRVRKMA